MMYLNKVTVLLIFFKKKKKKNHMRYVRDLIINLLCNHTLLYAKYIIFIDDIGYFNYALRNIDLILLLKKQK